MQIWIQVTMKDMKINNTATKNETVFPTSGKSLQYEPGIKGAQILHRSTMLIKMVTNIKDYG